MVVLCDPSLKEEPVGAPRVQLARSFPNDPSVLPGLHGVTILRAGQRWCPMECSNWQERDDRLFALCAEVARLTGEDR